MKFLLNEYESDRLIFRKISISDSDQWLEFFKDPRTSVHWIEEKESPEEECAKWYEKQLERYATDKGGMNALIEKESGKLVGHCGLLVQTVDGISELEIAYSLARFLGQRICFQSSNRLPGFCFSTSVFRFTDFNYKCDQYSIRASSIEKWHETGKNYRIQGE